MGRESKIIKSLLRELDDLEKQKMQVILRKYIHHFREDNLEHSVYKAMAEYADLKVDEIIKLLDENTEENPRRQT